MKTNKIAAAVAASCALFAGAAHATAPGAPADITLYLSGASAEDNALRMLFENICVRGTAPGSASDTLDVFLGNGTGNDYSGLSCTLDSTKLDPASVPANFPTNPTLLLIKRSAGGSGMGGAGVLSLDSSATIASVVIRSAATEPALNRFSPSFIVATKTSPRRSTSTSVSPTVRTLGVC